MSSDTRPCPGVQALFTAAWAGSGAEKPAQAPPGETAAAVARCRPRGCSPPTPRPQHPLQTSRAAPTVAVFLHFAIPAPSIKPWVGDKSNAISPGRIGRGKTRPGLQNPSHVKRAGAFEQCSPGGGKPHLPTAQQQQHPSRPSSRATPGAAAACPAPRPRPSRGGKKLAAANGRPGRPLTSAGRRAACCLETPAG